MKKYDIRCRNCGRMNYNLLLEDSGGWMECEECGCMRHVPLAERRRGEVSAGMPKQIPARPYAANGQMWCKLIYKHLWLCPHCGKTMMAFLHDDELSVWISCDRCGLPVNYTRVSRRRRMILYDE